MLNESVNNITLLGLDHLNMHPVATHFLALYECVQTNAQHELDARNSDIAPMRTAPLLVEPQAHIVGMNTVDSLERVRV